MMHLKFSFENLWIRRNSIQKLYTCLVYMYPMIKIFLWEFMNKKKFYSEIVYLFGIHVSLNSNSLLRFSWLAHTAPVEKI